MSTPTETHEAYAIATCNRVVAVAMLKTVGKLAEQLMDIPNVATKVSLLPCNNPRHRYCTLDETQRIINAALAYPNKAVYPKRELLPKKVTTFIEFLTDSLN